MKKTIISALLLIAVMFSFAGNIEEKAKAKTDALVKELSLTKEQTSKVTAIYVTFLTAKEELKSLKETNKAEFATKIGAAKDKMAASLGGVFTAEQAKKFKVYSESNNK
jgi:hypothetical protein